MVKIKMTMKHNHKCNECTIITGVPVIWKDEEITSCCPLCGAKTIGKGISFEEKVIKEDVNESKQT